MGPILCLSACGLARRNLRALAQPRTGPTGPKLIKRAGQVCATRPFGRCRRRRHSRLASLPLLHWLPCSRQTHNSRQSRPNTSFGAANLPNTCKSSCFMVYFCQTILFSPSVLPPSNFLSFIPKSCAKFSTQNSSKTKLFTSE